MNRSANHRPLREALDRVVTSVGGGIVVGPGVLGITCPRLAPWMLVVAAVISGCDTCGQPGQSWTYTGTYTGNIDAPADLELPTQVNSGSCTGGFSDGTNTCMQVGSCSPSFCLEAFAGGAAALNVQLSLASLVDGARVFTLPAANVVVTAIVFQRLDGGGGEQSTLTPMSGVVEVLSVKPSFDALVDLVLLTPDGRTITISGARYTRSNGHYKKYCGVT